jgi:uncharacterized protein YqgC (DUF456 family)
MSILGWILLVIGWLVGIVIIPFGLPGTFVIVVVAFIFALLTDFQSITWSFIGILLSLSILVELIEFFLSAAAAKKYGSSKWGMWGAIIGGFFGAIWATPISPILGTIFGAFIGAFIGAFVFEYIRDSDSSRALRSGWGAFLGAVTGRLLKLIVAIAMVVMMAFRVW